MFECGDPGVMAYFKHSAVQYAAFSAI